MKRLTEYQFKKQRIETKPITVSNHRIKRKHVIKLPVDVSFTLEKYLPKVSIRDQLPKRNFYRITSRDLMSVHKKHIETNLVHSSIDRFNICLSPFINLNHLKLDNCECFDGRFLTRTIRTLILHDIKHIYLKDIVLDSLELGYMDGKCLENIQNCHVNILIFKKIKNLNYKHIQIISFNSLEIRDCDIEFDKYLKIHEFRPFIDLIYENKTVTFHCLQNNYEMRPWLFIRECPEMQFKHLLERIHDIDIDHIKHLNLINEMNITRLKYVGNDLDCSKLQKVAEYGKLIELELVKESHIPQILIYKVVSKCRYTLRLLDITGTEISRGFLDFLKKTLKNCTVKYSDGQILLL